MALEGDWYILIFLKTCLLSFPQLLVHLFFFIVPRSVVFSTLSLFANLILAN